MADLKVQRAIVFRTLGDTSVLEDVKDWPVPVPGKGQILVAVKAAGVNPVDASIRGGKDFPKAITKLPQVSGCDFAGTVAAIPEGTETDLKVGDRVYGLADGWAPWASDGSFAQYTVVTAANAARIPEKVSYTDAAGIPIAGLTAWQALDVAGLEAGSGKRVFISSGAGGVGTFAVQFAKLRGLHVTTSASPANADFLKDLGADEVYDYHKKNLVELYKDNPFDAVIDSRGGKDLWEARKVLKHNGALASVESNGYVRDYGWGGRAVHANSFLRQCVAAPWGKRERASHEADVQHAAMMLPLCDGGVECWSAHVRCGPMAHSAPAPPFQCAQETDRHRAPGPLFPPHLRQGEREGSDRHRRPRR
uniref:Enoyl reductase (ER) domain-containing protein n=1 Tax=Auxenochlorella protothecoides TaxID=3075 RepID=A0A1D2AAB1_AUXPR